MTDKNNNKRVLSHERKKKSAYIKLAKHFYNHHMNGKTVNQENITVTLRELAGGFSTGYFRRLKNAIAFDLTERNLANAAEFIRKIANPVTAPGSSMARKPKRSRAKSFSDNDLAKIAKHLATKGHNAEWAALTLIRFTGVRPAELKSMTVKEGVVVILGAKKSHAGTRGADRILVVSDQTTLLLIENCLTILKASTKSMDAIRHRLRAEGLKLWPRRSAIPTLYSMRHQFGSNLKASGLSAREMAYIMGHQSRVLPR